MIPARASEIETEPYRDRVSQRAGLAKPGCGSDRDEQRTVLLKIAEGEYLKFLNIFEK